MKQTESNIVSKKIGIIFGWKDSESFKENGKITIALKFQNGYIEYSKKNLDTIMKNKSNRDFYCSIINDGDYSQLYLEDKDYSKFIKRIKEEYEDTDGDFLWDQSQDGVEYPYDKKHVCEPLGIDFTTWKIIDAVIRHRISVHQ